MKVSGFTFIRNGVQFDYPFIESLQSLLLLCDEVIVAVGNSNDNTLDHILALNSKKIKTIETVWDDSLREGGLILSQQTNIALDHATGDWAIYLQADEVLHEKDYEVIRQAMYFYKDKLEVEGFLFNYNHFYGSYKYIGNSRKWYRKEIRIVRPNIGVSSWGDAQGFRINGRKLFVKQINASIFHYGWVKPPKVQQLKQKYFNKLWHPDDWVLKNIGSKEEYDYKIYGRLKLFDGTHPAVMKERIEKQNWYFDYDASKSKIPLKDRLLDSIADKIGLYIGEYKNYKLL